MLKPVVGGAVAPSISASGVGSLSGSDSRLPTAHQERGALRTGQKVYDLDVSNQFVFTQHNFVNAQGDSDYCLVTGGFKKWTDARFENICKYMEKANPSLSEMESAFPETKTPLPVANFAAHPSSQVCISHQVLKTDGFVLGRFIKCAQDQDACDPSRFAVFEVYLNDLLLPPP
jgi:hypothetical protein